MGTIDQDRLVAGLRDGDEAMYEVLVREYGRRMLLVARRLMRDEDDARDCVQEALLQAFRKIDTFEGRSALNTWLHRIVVNAALSKLRSRERKREDSLDELLPKFDDLGCRIEPQSATLRSVESIVEQKENAKLVRRAIDELPETYRTVLLLRDIEHLNTEETATLLEISANAVKIRLHRARAILKKKLEPLLREGLL